MSEGIVIRPEREADHAVITEVVRAAFVRHPPDEVPAFVERIRASEEFIPELALVAEDSSGVIAHVMLSWVGVEGGSRTRILNLTPMSVRPDRQRIGVGARLIRDALARAEEGGEPAVMVEAEGCPRPVSHVADRIRAERSWVRHLARNGLIALELAGGTQKSPTARACRGSPSNTALSRKCRLRQARRCSSRAHSRRLGSPERTQQACPWIEGRWVGANPTFGSAHLYL